VLGDGDQLRQQLVPALELVRDLLPLRVGLDVERLELVVRPDPEPAGAREERDDEKRHEGPDHWSCPLMSARPGILRGPSLAAVSVSRTCARGPCAQLSRGASWSAAS